MSPAARRSLAVLMLLAAVLALPRPAGAAASTYYLAPAGNDAGPGNLAAPWRTFTAALPKLSPGDTLLVRGGTYDERFNLTVFRNPGTASQRITVQAYPGERPVVRGYLNIRGAHYWTFDGINVTWDGATGKGDPLVKLVNGVGWIFRNAEVWNAHSQAGILVGTSAASEPNNWTLAGNCVHDTVPSNGVNNDHNLYIASGDGGSGVIERNILFNSLNGENVKLGGSTASSRPTGYVTVRYNTMYNAGQNVVIPWGSHHNTVEWNIMGKAVGKSWYPNVRGYANTGKGNVARNNLGFAAARLLLNTDSNSTQVSYGIADKGGNRFPVNPLFDSASCSGFVPQEPLAQDYGRYGGVARAGDWDGDGDQTPGLALGGNWSLRNANSTGGPDVGPFNYGRPTDQFVTGDWDGNGTDTVGLLRAGVWYLRNGAGPGPSDLVFSYGRATDLPIVGDWDGDGVDTIGVRRGNVLYLRNANSAGPSFTAFSYGRSTDRFVTGDWDGNGTDTIGVFRAGMWYLRNSNSGGAGDLGFSFGTRRDVPVTGDFDGDGTDTIGILRGSGWYLRNANAPGNPDIGPFTFSG